MLSAIKNNEPSFTSVIPVRVFVDGMETYNSKNIRTACHQLSTILAGPARNNQHKLNLIQQFAKYDPDYNLQAGINGYTRLPDGRKTQPSDYFRCICDETQSFLFTGLQAIKLKELGKSVGKEQSACKARKIPNSFDLMEAKRKYGYAIANFIRSKKMRIYENFNRTTREASGAPVTLNINMNSNGKYGLTTFKINLDSISFTKSS